MTPEDFYSTYSGLANDISARTNLDPNLTMGLIAQETGWGDHAVGSNIYGIMNGSQVRQYGDVNAASDDFVKLLNTKYALATQQTTPAAQAAALVRLGYNTADTGYAHHISLNAAHIGQIRAKLAATGGDGGGGDGGSAGQTTVTPPPPGGGDGTGGDQTQLAQLTPQQQIQKSIDDQKKAATTGTGGTLATTVNPPEKTPEEKPASAYPPGSVGESLEQANQSLPSFLRPPGPNEEAGMSPFTWKRRNTQTGEVYNVVPDIIRAPIAGAGKIIMGEPYQSWGSDPDVGGLFTTLAGSRSPAHGMPPANPLITKPPEPTPGASRPTVPPVEPPPTPVEAGNIPPGMTMPKPPDVTGFQTAKGSTYVVNPEDGTTIRNKAPRPEHPGDSGIKPPSEVTFYVKPEDVGRFATPQGSDWRVVATNDEGTAYSVVTKNPDGKWGVAPSQNNIQVSKTPAVGLHPVELNQRADIGIPGGNMTGYKEMHPGNPITQVSHDPVPSFSGGAPTPGTPAAEPAPAPAAPAAQPYTPPSQQQIDQVVHGITEKFKQAQQLRGAGVLGNIGDAELRSIIRGAAGLLGAPGMILNAVDIAYNLASTFFRGRKMGRSIDAFEQELRDRLHSLTGGGGGSPPAGGGGSAAVPPAGPPSPLIVVPRRPLSTGVGAVENLGLRTTPTANAQNPNRLRAPPGADMKNRLIYKQAK